MSRNVYLLEPRVEILCWMRGSMFEPEASKWFSLNFLPRFITRSCRWGWTCFLLEITMDRALFHIRSIITPCFSCMARKKKKKIVTITRWMEFVFDMNLDFKKVYQFLCEIIYISVLKDESI